MGKTSAKKDDTKKTHNTTANETRIGDGVAETAIKCINQGMNEITRSTLTAFFNAVKPILSEKAKNLPCEIYEKWLNKPETEKEITALWTQTLNEKGLIPKSYNGLPDDLLIHNIHQDGYNDGMFVGYLITLTTLAEYGLSKEELQAAQRIIVPKLLSNSYEERDTLISKLKGEIDLWTENTDKREG